jgi:Zn finger protein HypA/HybF involved in hydrogenase expression
MKRIIYLGAFVLSALLLGLGILFACAASAAPARWPLAVALIGIGLVGAGGSAFAYRRWADTQPDALAARITDLAAAQQGEVTLAQIMSTFNVTASAAQAGLDVLANTGVCERDRHGEQDVFTFPGLKEHKVERRCPFCGAAFPVKQALQKCPNCGGNLELVKE